MIFYIYCIIELWYHRFRLWYHAMAARQNARIKTIKKKCRCCLLSMLRIGRALGSEGLALGSVGNRRALSNGTCLTDAGIEPGTELSEARRSSAYRATIIRDYFYFNRLYALSHDYFRLFPIISDYFRLFYYKNPNDYTQWFHELPKDDYFTYCATIFFIFSRHIAIIAIIHDYVHYFLSQTIIRIILFEINYWD
jgi:hypothetical protein